MTERILTQKREFQKLSTMCDFVVSIRDRFEAGSPAAKAVPEVIATVADLKMRTAAQAGLEGRILEASRRKLEAREELRGDMKFRHGG